MIDEVKALQLATEYELASKDLIRAQEQVEQFSMQRAYAALAMVELGFQHVEVGDRLGITGVRVSQLASKARKDREKRRADARAWAARKA